jgi:hypothetical protein
MSTLIKENSIYKWIQLDSFLATLNNASEIIDTSAYVQGDVQVLWSGNTDTSTFEVQHTLDNSFTLWDTVAGTSTTTSGGSGSAMFRFENMMPGGWLALCFVSRT